MKRGEKLKGLAAISVTAAAAMRAGAHELEHEGDENIVDFLFAQNADPLPLRVFGGTSFSESWGVIQ
jgi:hypothetical protein